MQDGPGPRPFDVSTRRLIESDPAGWLSWVGFQVNGPVETVDSEISTVLAEVDKVLRVEAASPWIAHIEVQSGRDPDLPLRLLQYHALLLYRHKTTVESTVVLLRSEADGPELAGRLDRHGSQGDPTVSFWFRVVRLWERPVDELLDGSLGILPLAPLAAVEPERLPSVIQRLDERFEREASTMAANELWAATQLLLGLRYDAGEVGRLLGGITRMRESSTYQAILEEGRVEGRVEGREEGRLEGQMIEARRLLLDLGSEKFGPPTPATVMTVDGLDDLATLHRLARSVFRASSWQDLLTVASDR